MCSRKASRLSFRAGLSRLLRWAYFSSRSAISPLQIKQLARSGTQAGHPRASPVHSLGTGKALVVLRILSRRAQRILNWWYCIASSRPRTGWGVRGGASQGHQVLGDATGRTAHGLEPELLGPLVLALLA